MRLSEVLLGSREFYQEEGIRDAVVNCPYFDSSVENIEKADLLLIFKTSTQQSWLVFTEQRIYFVLDDKGETKPDVRWRRVKDHLVADNRVTIDLKLENKSGKTGRVNIGRMNKGFLYTKGLFESNSIKNAIYSLIEKHMLQRENT